MTPHRRRWYVVAALVLLALITIVDRVCISAGKLQMAGELQISNIEFGWVFGVFTLGYAVAMIPVGWCADRWGPRRFLTLIVCIWSVLTAATGLVGSFAPLVVLRFIFGMAEAGAYPGATRAIYNWIPISERGLALGLFNFGARMGAAAGLTMVSFIVIHTGWRNSFILLGGVGLIWAALWFLFSRDLPPGAAPPLAEIKPTGDWPKIALSAPALLLFYQYFAINFTFFLGYSWLLPHLEQEFHLDPGQAGVYASIPLYCGALAAWCGGNIVDRLYRRGYGAMSRAIPAIAGFTLAVMSVLAVAYVTTAEAFVALFAAAVFGLDLAVSPSWTTCSDLGGPNTGAVSACMNMVGSVGAFLSTIAFPFVIKLTGRTRSYFILATILNVLGALSWIKLGRASHFFALPSPPPESPQTQTHPVNG